MLYCFKDNESFLAFLRSLRTETFFEKFQVEPDALQWNEADRLGFLAEEGGELTGAFVFNCHADDCFLEKKRWFTDSEAACRGMLDYLKTNYPAFRVEFTLDPRERLLLSLLAEYGAQIFPEQQNMERFAAPAGIAADSVQALSETYREQYLALHRENDDGAYWTGEKVLSAPDRFYVLVAMEGESAVGYVDVARWETADNVSDLYVRPQDRRKGYGARLLAKAAELSAPKRMTLQVDVDNIPALGLYEKLGFRRIEGENTVDAIWQLG